MEEDINFYFELFLEISVHKKSVTLVAAQVTYPNP